MKILIFLSSHLHYCLGILVWMRNMRHYCCLLLYIAIILMIKGKLYSSSFLPFSFLFQSKVRERKSFGTEKSGKRTSHFSFIRENGGVIQQHIHTFFLFFHQVRKEEKVLLLLLLLLPNP